VKRWTLTLIALGIFALLLAYVLLVEGKREPPPEPRPGVTPSPTPALVLDVALDDVQALQIVAADRTLRLVHEGAEWSIAGPPDVPADSAALSWPVGEVIHLEARLIVSDQISDLATYGLDVPALTLTIETREGAEQIRAGRVTPDGTAFYVQRQGDPRLYIVDHYVIDNLFQWLDNPPYLPTPTPGA
jgi:hypothetical protein